MCLEIGITFKAIPHKVTVGRRRIYFEDLFHFRNPLDQNMKVAGYADVSLTGELSVGRIKLNMCIYFKTIRKEKPD